VNITDSLQLFKTGFKYTFTYGFKILPDYRTYRTILNRF
jgi:hypothetical protein